MLVSRRSYLACVGATALSGCGALETGCKVNITPNSITGWPTPRRGSTNTASVEPPGVRGTGTVSRDWQFDIGGEVRGVVATADTAVVASRELVNGEHVPTLHAIRLDSGAELWNRSVRHEGDGTLGVSDPMIVGEYVFASVTRSAADTNASVVVAVSIRDGTVSWKQTFDSFHLTMASPGLLLGRGRPRGYQALHPDTGEKCWAYTPGEGGFFSSERQEEVRGYPAIAAETIVTVVSNDQAQYLAGVDPQNGREKWRTELTGAPSQFATPIVTEGSVLVPTETRVWAYNIEDGQLEWMTARISDPGLTFMAANRSTIVITGANLHAIDRRSQTKRWTVEDGGLRPALAGRTLYIPSRRETADGEYTSVLEMRDAHSGEVVGAYPLPDGNTTRPLLAGGKLVIGIYDATGAYRRGTIEAVSRN